VTVVPLGLHLDRVLFRLQLPDHDLRHSAHVFHRRVDLLLLLPQTELVLRRGHVLRVRGYASVSKRRVPELTLHVLLVHFPLRPFGFGIDRVPIVMVLEPEHFGPQALVLLVGEVSEKAMWAKFALIEFCYDHGALLHFS